MKNTDIIYGISVEHCFRAAHFITLGDGTTEAEHPHNWQITATIETKELDNNGLVMDFMILKDYLAKITKPYEEIGCLNKHNDFINKPATTENIARVIFEKCRQYLPGNVKMIKLELTEEPGCKAYCRT